MPKAKTHSGAKKRFLVTGSGKFKAKSSGRRHNLGKRDKQAKRRLAVDGTLPQTEKRRVALMLNVKTSLKKNSYDKNAENDSE